MHRRFRPGDETWKHITPIQRSAWMPFAQNTLERHYNSSFMAAGDAQRVWFPEMIERLRSQWREGMSCDSLIGLRDDLDAMLQRIWSDF
ncbi:MAG: hypothetical protein ABSB15_16895 [Bryobacteraceae bacterium]|jgi:hypothetical protein